MPYPFVDREVLTNEDLNAALQNPHVLAAGGTTRRYMADRLADVKNVLDFGATGNGSTDDTAAIQAALDAVDATHGGDVYIPRGRYLFSAPLVMKSRTRVYGQGVLHAAEIGAWAASPYFGLTNANNDATSIVDHDIAIEDITLDYTDLPSADGTRHCVYIHSARRVLVENVTTIGGSSAVAIVACDDSWEVGNRMYDFTNAGSDHWAGESLTGPKNARVVGCHMESGDGFEVAQMMNWNPDPTTGANSNGYVADGFIFIGNTVISHEAAATPCQVEPLRSGGVAQNIVIASNHFVNSYLVVRGDTRGLTIESNQFSGFAGTAEVITGYTRVGGTPSDASIMANVIRDPTTTVGNVAVIRMESATATIAFNRISGTAYGALPISVGSTTGQIFGNQMDATPIAGYLQTGFVIPAGSSSLHYMGFRDNAGTTPRFYCQSTDNNFLFHGTGAAGGQRTIWSAVMRSDTSEFTVSIPAFVNGTLRTAVTASLAATGTNIATAAALTSNCTLVTSATAGVNDGVRLSATTGLPQEVVNGAADTIKVYPNNSGSSEIDDGGASIPVTIAPGKSKTFRQFASGDFRTVAAT